MKTETKTAEELLREYVKFDDANGSETVELLPLTIVDIMEEYGNQRFIEGKKEGISETVDVCSKKSKEYCIMPKAYIDLFLKAKRELLSNAT